MKVRITEKGAHGANGERLSVGQEFEVKGDIMPGYLVGKAKVISKGRRAAVTNPAQGAAQQATDPQPSAQERQHLLGEITANDLADDDFNGEGVPDVRKVNDHVPDGSERFSADERNQLWPGIADTVKAARDAVQQEQGE